MDTKFYSNNGLSGAGRILFLTLVAGLGVTAVALDWLLQQSISTPMSLTLPLGLSFAVTAALGYWAVPFLRALKTGQFIREDGPQAHLAKAGTPTMGGLFFVLPAVGLALIISGFASDAIAVSVMTLAYAVIGWVDDWQILRRKSNKGISPRLKLMLQVGVAIAFCVWLVYTQPSGITTIAVPFGLTLPLGLLFWLVAGFVPVAQSNATNLTDGLDGLAGGTGAIALLGLAVLAAPTSAALMVFCACMSGACLGFLVHNHNPAQVFMGDTGSMALGGGMAAVALLSNSLFGLLILSGIFLAESVSVMLQVGYYKATKDENGVGQRLFKMAPLHHHLELSGWSETKVVGVFYLVSGLLALLCLVLMVHV